MDTATIISFVVLVVVSWVFMFPLLLKASSAKSGSEESLARLSEATIKIEALQMRLGKSTKLVTSTGCECCGSFNCVSTQWHSMRELIARCVNCGNFTVYVPERAAK